MATGRPAGTLGDVRAVVIARDIERAGSLLLLLEVAFQAEDLVTGGEHLLVDGTVRVVAGRATFAHSLVLKHKRSTLRGMALKADLIFAHDIR